MKTVSEKIGIKENTTAYFVNAPLETIEAINLPDIKMMQTLKDEFDYSHLFVKSQAEQMEIFPKLKDHLKLEGMLWVSWPKNRQLDTDLTLPKVIKIGYEFGLVESTCLSLDTTLGLH